MLVFFIFSPSSNHLHPLQVENCDSNSRLLVDEDDYGKFRLKRVKSNSLKFFMCSIPQNSNSKVDNHKPGTISYRPLRRE